MTNLYASIYVESSIECPQCGDYLDLNQEDEVRVDRNADYSDMPRWLVDFMDGKFEKGIEYNAKCEACGCKFKFKTQW